jgi:P2 family phage contractile tail tube protein
MTLYKFESAATWLNGTSLLGHIEELELPEIEWEMDEHEAIGLRGVAEFPKRVNPLEATITWADYFPELAAAAADPWTAVELQIRANFGAYDGSSKTGDVLQVITLGGRFKTNTTGTYSSDEYERESMMAVDYFKEAWDGLTLLEYGVNPPIYRTGANGSSLGTDLFAQLRSNLGI